LSSGPRPKHRGRSPLAWLIAAPLLLGGCGYTTGLSLAPEYGSVGVELFGNDSRARDLERDLHVSLTQVLRDRVDAELRAPALADVVLRGVVLDFRFRPGIRSRENVQLETGLIVIARGSLWDRVSGLQVAGPITTRAHVGYALEDPQAEIEARRRVLDLVAERMILELLTTPGTPEGPPEPPRR
jgi:hypothetical protein